MKYQSPRVSLTPRLSAMSRRPWLLWGIPGVLLVGALAVLPLPVAAALIVGLPFVVLVLREPVFGLYGAVLSVPVQELVALPAGLTVTQAVVALATGAWLLQVLAYPDRRLNLRFQWPWVIFLSWQLLAVITTPYSLGSSLQQWARWVAAWLAFVLTVVTITDRRRAWGLIAVLFAAPGLAALLGIEQFLTASGPPSYLILGGRFARAAATFVKPNPFAGYLNMTWPLAVALAAYFGTRRLRGGDRTTLLLMGLFAGVTGVLLMGLFASYSRGGWIGAVVGGLTLALLGGRRSAAIAAGAIVVGLLVGLLGVFSALPPVVAERLGAITNNLRVFDAGVEPINDANFAVVERMAHWQAAWRMWQAHPVLGIGPGSFNAAYPEFFVGNWAISQGHAHNYYLHILAEAGPLGLGFYLLLVGTIFVQMLRLRRLQRATVGGALALGGCGIMLAVASHNVFENLHVLNLGIQLSGVWGLLVVAERFAPHQVS